MDNKQLKKCDRCDSIFLFKLLPFGSCPNCGEIPGKFITPRMYIDLYKDEFNGDWDLQDETWLYKKPLYKK